MSPEQTTRPAAPGTPAELERSTRIITRTVGGAVLMIVGVTALLVLGLDAEPVPLIPVAALLVVVDLWFLAVFRRRRRAGLEQLRRDQAGVSG